jgi:hypothetical protein
LQACKDKILSGEWERNLAARGFIELLQYLWVVLIQDAAVLFDHLPAKLQQHQVFGESFQQYRTQLLTTMQVAQHPVEAQLQVAMPLLAQQMSTQHAAVMDRIVSTHTNTVKLVGQLQGQLTSSLHGDISFRLQPVSGNTSPGVSHMQASEQDNLNSSSEHTEVSPSTCSGSPQYSMSRGVNTVRELWTEWHKGLANQPSIEALERSYGTKWRSSVKENKFFSRRLYVIKYVRGLVQDGVSVEAAIEKADSEPGSRSIDAFSKWLRKNNSHS